MAGGEYKITGVAWMRQKCERKPMQKALGPSAQVCSPLFVPFSLAITSLVSNQLKQGTNVVLFENETRPTKEVNEMVK